MKILNIFKCKNYQLEKNLEVVIMNKGKMNMTQKKSTRLALLMIK